MYPSGAGFYLLYLTKADGLIDVVGVGEAPVGRLATFSLWESAAAVRSYAYGMPRHQRVIDETRIDQLEISSWPSLPR